MVGSCHNMHLVVCLCVSLDLATNTQNDGSVFALRLSPVEAMRDLRESGESAF